MKIPKQFQKFKPHKQRLKDGDIVDTYTCAKIVGYTPDHVRRLCRGVGRRDEKPIPHERRGRQFFFRPADVEAILARVR